MKPIIKWDDLSIEEKKLFSEGINTVSNKNAFSEVSSLIQQKLTEENRLILNPVENWTAKEMDEVRIADQEIGSCRAYCDFVVGKLTTPIQEKQKITIAELIEKAGLNADEIEVIHE